MPERRTRSPDGSSCDHRDCRCRPVAAEATAVTAQAAVGRDSSHVPRGAMVRPSAAQHVTRAAALSRSFAATAAHHDRTADFPFENFAALRDAGLLALTVTRDDGGLGGGLTDAQFVVGEIARGEPATALVLAMHY